MMKIHDNSKNYTAQLVRLPTKQNVDGLTNLVKVCVQGNDTLITKDYDENGLYVYFGPETKLSHEFLSVNNLYRHSELNQDKTRKGFFEDNGRVRTVKFRGVISSAFLTPISSLSSFCDVSLLKTGDEFNELNGKLICEKYVVKHQYGSNSPKDKKAKIVDEIINSRLVPEHFETSHLMKNLRFIKPDDVVSISHKIHGVSCRVFHTNVNRKLKWYEKILRYLKIDIKQDKHDYVVGSRHVIKSVGFDTLKNKNHFYDNDIWTQVSKQFFEGKLNIGESVYFEIYGSDNNKKALQPGYSYGYTFPKIAIYRISNINEQGVEIDLSYEQMKERADQLGIPVCKEFYVGKFGDLLRKYRPDLNESNLDDVTSDVFYNHLLEKPSYLDNSVVEEGFCVRFDSYPRPKIFKIKSKLFLAHETKMLDKGEEDVESAT